MNLPSNVEMISAGGYSIHVETFPRESSIGHVLFVHGFGDYGKRRFPLMTPLYDKGYTITVYDHPGHGKSSGVRGYVESMDTLDKCLNTVIRAVGVPVHLVGESMGALVCMNYLLNHPNDERVLSVTSLAGFFQVHDEMKPPPFAEGIARFLAKFIPTAAVLPSLSGKVHYDMKVEQEFIDDPLTYSSWLRLGTGVSLTDGLQKVKEGADQLKKPILFIHGTNDRVADVEGVKYLYAKADSTKKVLHLVEKGEHILDEHLSSFALVLLEFLKF